MSNSTQSRKRLHELACNLSTDSKASFMYRPTMEDTADLRALLASERELRRENAAMRKALRRVKVNADDLIKLREMGVKL